MFPTRKRFLDQVISCFPLILNRATTTQIFFLSIVSSQLFLGNLQMALSDISCFQFCLLGCLQRLTYLRNCLSLSSRSREGKESQLFYFLMITWAQRSLSIWRKFVVYKSMQIYLSSGYCPTKNVFGNPVRALYGSEMLLTQQILPLLLQIKGLKVYMI